MAAVYNAVDLPPVDRQVWKSIAGHYVFIPTVGSLVYYFPQGHAEHATPVPDINEDRLRKKWSLCRVTDINFFANPESDEIFYKAELMPVREGEDRTVPEPVEGDGRRIVSFSKTLTQSDANNGGGFSVPRFCADSILPELDYNADPPVQRISVKDVNGSNWEFRHIYRGTPRRHLLTTGWSNFINSKRLMAGDSVVFCKKPEGEIYIGVRRGGSVFRRNGRLRVRPESVLEAVEAADSDAPFEVVYYPRWSAEFLVKASVVDVSMREPWEPGTTIRMSVETDDPARRSWHYGTVTSVKNQHLGPWSCSPWRMLEVRWDDPELLTQRLVSPWQVQKVPGTRISNIRGRQNLGTPTYREPNMLRPRNSAHPTNGGHTVFVRGPGFNVPTTRSVTVFLVNGDIIPAGMQGVRQGPVCVSSLSSTEPDSRQGLSSANCPGGNVSPKSKHVPNEVKVCGSQQSESSSPPSQTSVLDFDKSSKSNANSFLLFGNVIQTEQPDVPLPHEESASTDDCFSENGDGH